jgi:5-methylcytosine-specific restriction endonuclease McrA
MADFPRSKRMSYQPKLVPQVRLNRNQFYQSKAWRELRNKFIQDNQLCKHCKEEGNTVFGKEVDHIKGINPSNAYDTKGGYYGDPLDPANLQTLCTMHHARKSGKERHSK